MVDNRRFEFSSFHDDTKKLTEIINVLVMFDFN